MRAPLILDFDGSLKALPDAERVALGDWQERIRFGCRWPDWLALEGLLERLMPQPSHHGTVCMGSGDFHHLSHLLIKRQRFDSPVDVLVFDNHPDNMRFPFGIHCGSWVKHVAALPGVAHVHVIGIGSTDVGIAHAWENHLRPLYAGHVYYWTLGVDTRWAGYLGLGKAFRSFSNKRALLDALHLELKTHIGQCYLSIDKDVLAQSEARTNWDQGQLLVSDLQAVIDALRGRIVGSDITGEVSIHHYQSRWKRMLSALDDQPVIDPVELSVWQARQIEVNQSLLRQIAEASV